ncbi:MAG: DNA mismatch repair protein MutS [Spirochaetales bacterium]|jgi:DNA mismatch repair protein MutS|nr:DNA mismatch repair protein MutS [Spirochaetales bacterium]
MMKDNSMMSQYARIKQRHRDAVLFFRLGDFYEMFGQDAKEVSALLGLTLTHRQSAPMCGIPYHASHSYIERLLKAGKKIAICEQLSAPGKGLVQREVVEIISPGTVVDEEFLDRSLNNFILSAAEAEKGLSLSAVDISTGDFIATWFAPEERTEGLRRELHRLSPREILIQEALLHEDSEIEKIIRGRKNLVVNSLPDWSFDSQAAYKRLLRLFGTANLKGFGCEETSPEILSAGVLIEYLEENAKSSLSHIKSFRKYQESDYLVLDESTLRNLELVRNLQDGSEKYSLFEVINHAKTAMGTRLLRSWVLAPLVEEKAILARQEIVASVYHDQICLKRLRDQLAKVFDLERLSARIAMGRAHAKDLCAVRDSLKVAFTVHEEMKASGKNIDEAAISSLKELYALLEKSLADFPPIILTEGNMIREGYNHRLDELKGLQSNKKEVLDAYLEQEKKLSGIPSLHMRYNKIIGYFIEVTKSYTASVPGHFIRRQSLVGAERYTTEKLMELERQLLGASDAIVELEKELFLEVRAQAKSRVHGILSAGAFLAEIDALQSLAQAATLHGFTRPRVSAGKDFVITEGRHPVVEKYLPPGEFVPNGLTLRAGGEFFALITGPNMAGKSTYLRQTALIVILAQIGSFVPARDAEIAITDKIFCRVGAQDNLARGESTFLVEMNETANILRAATSKSLIIMDEVGRGTSTYDGLSIAWAVCEYILDSIGAKTLFATHYHELTDLKHSHLFNLSMDIREEKGSVIFLKRIKAGPSNNSYGIHVARLAGLPQPVLDRAAAILESLVAAKEARPDIPAPEKQKKPSDSLFSTGEILEEEVRSYPVEKKTPLEALNFLQRWQAILRGDKKILKKI